MTKLILAVVFCPSPFDLSRGPVMALPAFPFLSKIKVLKLSELITDTKGLHLKAILASIPFCHLLSLRPVDPEGSLIGAIRPPAADNCA